MNTVKAQNSHSLDFNGQSDYIEIADASEMIANSDQISITGWVYPRNTNSGWPNFDGFFGFRNEFDADFYLLQLDNYKVEGRLRISVNDYFTVVTDPNSISPETWYHLALVYDGTNLIVYINGTEAGSTGASGQITNEFVPLYVGRLVFQTTNFDLDGQADEVGLWNVALTAEQIQDYMYADLTGEGGLVGYWNFNEGSGEIANDASGNDNDGLIYGANWSTNIPFQGIYISDQQIEEDEELNMDLSYLGETMTFEAYSDTSAVSAVINGQSLLLTPLPNWHGISTITIYMTDDSNLLDTASFVLTVTSVNDPPTIEPVDDITMEEDGSASVFLNVTDADSENLIYNFYTSQQQPIFSFTVIEDTLYISPILNWNGQENLTIFVSDGEDSDNTSLVITVTPVNDAPTINPIDDITIVEDSTTSIIIYSEDIDSEDLEYDFMTDDPYFDIMHVANMVTISPHLNWSGQGYIIVSVSDGQDSADAGFTITVTPVNDRPESFTILNPTISDTFSTDIANDTLIPFSWQQSYDVDSDVTYKLTIELEFSGNVYTEVYENINDTTVSISSNSLDQLLSASSQSVSVVTYLVEASDEEFTVASSDRGFFVLNRSSLGVGKGQQFPEIFALHQNYPNPFNPITSIRYDLPQDAFVHIRVYDMLGRMVRSLANSQQAAGYHSIQWDAASDKNEPASAGIYIYTIQAGEFSHYRKMVLLK